MQLLWIAVLAAGIYLLLTVLLYVFQERLIFFPSSTITYTPADAGIGANDVYFESANGKTLHGWYAEADSGAVTILFSHGNAGNISNRVHTMETFLVMGFNVFIYDYQGYGRSEGRPTEKGIMQDGLAAWDVLVERKNVNPDLILPVGRSLGGAVAAHIAVTHQTAGLALESTFTSVPDVAARVYRIFPVRMLARVKLDNLKALGAYNGALLVGHSKTDQVIPYDMGRTLYESFSGPAHWLEMTGGHGDGYAMTGRSYSEAYLDFAERYYGVEL